MLLPRLVTCGLIFVAFISVCFSQTTKSLATDRYWEGTPNERLRQQREARVQDLLNAAVSYPIEVYADVAFLLLDVPNALSQHRKKEILSELFRRADEAREPIKLRQFEGVMDSRSAYRAKSLSLDRDALSIRLNVIRKMLPLDKARARELFIEIGQPKVKVLECKDDLGYELGDFYGVLRSLIETSFETEAIRNREPIFLAASMVDEIRSPAQLAPVIDLITQLRTSKEDFGVLINAFNRALSKTSGDPRSFISALKYDGLTRKVSLTLLPKIRAKGYQPLETINSYRTFIETNLSGIQCSDALLTGSKESPHPLVQQVNEMLDTPIDPENIKPTSTEAAQMSSYTYWRTPKASRLLAAVKRLRFGDGKVELDLTKRSDQAWEAQFLGFLRQMDEWKAEDEETVDDYLNQKSVLYSSLYELAPPGRLKDEVVIRYSVFIRDLPFQKEVPGQWLFYVKRLLAMAKAGSKSNNLLDQLNNAGCDICRLYHSIDSLRTSK